ncbi:MAG: 30S ribosomal protein S2 [Thermoprotei archaeon]|nr:30S ribosomal protein S2 [Thermoprotei archaeon]
MSSPKEKPEGQDLLVPLETYLAAGVRIGTHIKTKVMERFIYGVRPDGLYVINVRLLDERIRIAAKMIARYDPNTIVAVSARQYGYQPVKAFCSFTGAIPIVGRFVPGTFTNPSLPNYLEPSLLLASDPRADSQAIDEAAEVGIPVIALCDTDNFCEYVDLIIPVNNKGRRSLALVYWLLARQVLRERGELGPDEDLPVPVEHFETKIVSSITAEMASRKRS